MSQLLGGDRVPENQQMPVTGNRFTGTWLGDIPVALPADFVQGIDTQRWDLSARHPSYLRGEWADHGWWYYYLYALAIKEPLGTWCLAATALGLTVYDWRPREEGPPAMRLAQAGEGKSLSVSWRDELLVLAPFAAILAFVSSQTGFSAHPHYVVRAALCVCLGQQGRASIGNAPICRLAAGVDSGRCARTAWSVGSSLAIYPHSLSYFNELAALLTTPADASYPKSVILHRLETHRL